MENDDFKKCKDLQYELECKAESENYRSVLNFTQQTVEVKNYRGMGCRVRAWIEEHFLSDAKFEYLDIPATESYSGTVAGSTVSVIMLILIGILVIYLIRTKQIRIIFPVKKSEVMNIIPKNTNYNIFKKDSFLQENLARAIDSDTLKKEYNNIGAIVQEKIYPTMTFNIANANKDRNRYKDMVPYDNNIVTLETKTGSPPSDYVSASWIQFKNFPQKFIACQAPKPDTFAIFWQLVFEQKVQVIVMITDLVEGNKVKAHKYWPDTDNRVLNLEGGMKVKYLSHSYPGTYYHRKLIITSQHGVTHEVDQLQCTAWKDMAAPDDTKILLDLAYAIPALQDKQTPLLVHCSAGVGRTGTFVGFYKLIEDIKNSRVKEFSVFETVLEMRKCRKQMVQKDVQYIYLHKCLRDFVSAQESIYA
eukprot:GFUD01030634.1.p1 GENE.GFUD01030634.1~~GFUD01030634.1.p1  ORF type:complete len:437 (-),score=90.14 GFUD01030634.1:394-1647(-)